MAGAAYSKLPLLAQTAYARVLDLLLGGEEGGLEAGTSLVSKTIRGRRYWYAQRQEDGRKVQRYIGPETDEVLALIERARQKRADEASRSELIAMARAGGAYVLGAAESRVLQQLSGVFRLGGVLVGSYGFAVLGNSLGVRWGEAIVRTEDVDIAHDHRIAVALTQGGEPVDISRALDDAQPRLSILSPTYPATSFRVRNTDIEVELLTPMVGRVRSVPVHIAPLGAAATPLRFLDYLIEETQPGGVLGGSGVLVNVPRPGRFAFHKLIVASRRGIPAGGISKAPKDRAQAAALLGLLLAELPGEISLAWKALARRGRAWIAAARSSLALLDPALTTELRRHGVAIPSL